MLAEIWKISVVYSNSKLLHSQVARPQSQVYAQSEWGKLMAPNYMVCWRIGAFKSPVVKLKSLDFRAVIEWLVMFLIPGLTSQRHSALISSDSEQFQVCFSAVHYLKISEQSWFRLNSADFWRIQNDNFWLILHFFRNFWRYLSPICEKKLINKI